MAASRSALATDCCDNATRGPACADIIWENSTTNQRVIWQMKGGAVVQGSHESCIIALVVRTAALSPAVSSNYITSEN
jgi:hypothetical protein